MSLRRVSTAAGVCRAFVVAAAGVAWACTVQPSILSVGPMSSPPEAEVPVTGRGVAAGSVAIRWSSLQGQVLGVAAADARGDFSTHVAVPDVAPGVYSILAVAGDTGVARMAFEVTPAPGAASPLGSAAPAWAPRQATTRPASSTTGLVVGAALVGAGLVTLFSGALVAVARRRRATVTTG